MQSCLDPGTNKTEIFFRPTFLVFVLFWRNETLTLLEQNPLEHERCSPHNFLKVINFRMGLALKRDIFKQWL
jgi:hypothetical protein